VVSANVRVSFKCCLAVCNESVPGFIFHLWCLSFMRFPLLRFEIVNNLSKQIGVRAGDFSVIAVVGMGGVALLDATFYVWLGL
jgi:hypothetical protein